MPVTQTDLDAVLRHCRTLADVADELTAVARARADAATEALRRWNGDFAEVFEARIDDEAIDLADRARDLRSDADAWARIWADTLNAENRRRRSQAVEDERNRRGAGEQFVDFFHGDDSDAQVRPYHDVPTPSAASGYLATGELEFF